MSGLGVVFIAGTAMSLVSIQSFKSDVGKSTDTRAIEDCPPVSPEDITQRLHSILNMEGITCCNQSRLFRLEEQDEVPKTNESPWW